MPDANQIYVTCHGGWTQSPWTAEAFQIGFRLGVFPYASPPARGSLATMEEFPIEESFSSGTTTHYTRSNGWRGDPLALTEPVGTVTQQTALAEAAWSFMSTSAGYMSQAARWTHVKVAAVPFGTEDATGASVYTLTAPIAGGLSGSCPPPELALAMTLRAPIVGRRGRGRVYMPALSTGSIVAADGTVVVATQTALRAALVTLIGAFDALAFDENVYKVRTIVTSAKKLDGVVPTEVRTGNHWDVQRRRQAQVPETYTTTQLT